MEFKDLESMFIRQLGVAMAKHDGCVAHWCERFGVKHYVLGHMDAPLGKSPLHILEIGMHCEVNIWSMDSGEVITCGSLFSAGNITGLIDNVIGHVYN